MSNIKAKISKTEYTGKIRQNRREKHFKSQLTLVARDLSTPIIARFYSTQGICSACVWVNGKSNKHGARVNISGGGRAGGYGYHRPSEAFQSALNDAGVILNQDIGGRGDSAVSEALQALAKTLGYSKTVVIEAHS